MQAAHGGGLPPAGKDYLLRVRMNSWPADKKVGRRLGMLWQTPGVLWMAEIQSLPAKLRIENRSRASACAFQVD